ncbi:MAG: zf-HC2 domain-containing protein [Bryobacteraceae bacterium]|jgi:hypothetical protein
MERNWTTLYALGELPEAERSRFEEHFFDCPTCSEAVRRAYLLVRGAEATLHRPIFRTEQPVAAQVRQLKTARRVWPMALHALPYAALLLLSVGSGYEYLALQRARAPQTVVAFAIEPQAKGEPARIVLPAAGEFVELDFDIMDPASQYHWEIQPLGADGARLHGEAQAQAKALVLKLLIPTATLHPGRYKATITCPPDHRDEYPFEVTGGSGPKGNP